MYMPRPLPIDTLPKKIAPYGAMLGTMRGMYVGTEVGKTLAWEEVL